METSSSLDLEQGTISFWIRAGKFKWNNNQRSILFEASRENGGVYIMKDAKSKLQALLKLKEHKIKVSTDVSDLSNEKGHQIVFTWNKSENKIILYLDGKKVGENKIK